MSGPRKHWKYGLAATLLVLACAGAAYAYFTPHPKEVVVILTPTGFVPNKVYVNKGDTVTFVSNAGEQFWPASNFHPSHTLYPEFDPKRPLAPTEKWKFTFDKAGVWEFHDHLASQFTGTVLVRGTLGESLQPCLKQKNDTLNPVCWEADLRHILATQGLDATFNYVNQLYVSDPLFKRNCHDVMHFVGSATYEKFRTSKILTNRPEAAYCGYGFYHGFIEAMQAANGVGHYDEVRNYCEAIRRGGGEAGAGPCFHGVGHALFDSLDGKLWGNQELMIKTALNECEAAVPEEADRVQCSSGVYNSFANAASARNYNLSFDALDPVALCSAQKAEYQGKCYGEVGIGYIRNNHLNRAESLKWIRSLPSKYMLYELFGYFGDETKRAMVNFDPTKLMQDCMALASSERTACTEGVVEGVREESPPENAANLEFPFCKAFTDPSLRKHCLEYALSGTLSFVRSTDTFQQACNALPDIDHALCK